MVDVDTAPQFGAELKVRALPSVALIQVTDDPQKFRMASGQSITG